MNYYNPYLFTNPYLYNVPTITKPSFISKLLGTNINFTSILNGTQKTLNVVNQVIPIIKQAGPVINNAKTMFKVMNEFKRINEPVLKENKPTNNKKITLQEMTKKEPTTYEVGPMFFQ